MGNKNKAERRAGHVAFEQRRAAKEQKAAPEKFTTDQIRLAASFTLTADVNQPVIESFLPRKIVENIASGRFTATNDQQKQIITAARAMGWSLDRA